MEDLYGLTAKELDEILGAMGLQKDGSKADKIERLQDKIYIETQGETPEVKDYEMRLWAGKIYVYVCSHCGRQYDDRDKLFMHILGHYPENEREAVLDRLLKEGEK